MTTPKTVLEASKQDTAQNIDTSLLKDKLVAEILQARERVYHVGKPTPLEQFTLENNITVFVKREDLSPIKAYKWRGAYNAMALHTKGKTDQEVVAASAGNHAQGVALAARRLGVQARIYMPLSTPRLKQDSVARLGGDNVKIILEGDDYNVAAAAAKSYAAAHNSIYIHPFDDLYTIAGQATIADELVLSGQGPFDYAFIQIGGGGMAAGVSTWLKMHYPDIKIIGVEQEGQASMKAAIEAGAPITLDSIDTFCDGTAVTRAGDLCHALCQSTLDEVITVSNDETSGAIQNFWEQMRVIPETSGALGLAGLLRYNEDNPGALHGKKAVTIISGANLDFNKLALIASSSAIGTGRKHYYRFQLPEARGSLLNLLDTVFAGINITGFQYGKIREDEGCPTVAFEANHEQIEALEKEMTAKGLSYEQITNEADARYRVINYDPSLFKNPLLMHVHFPERHGALRDFLKTVSEVGNICYFNYAYSGESIGRALMGFEFDKPEAHEQFKALMEDSVVTCQPVEEDTARRILAHRS